MRINIKHSEVFSTIFKLITNIQLHKPIMGITSDSREVRKNDLFIAIKGNNVDGNNFIKSIYKLDASAALVSRINKNIDIQQIKVNDPLKILSEIANLWRKQYNIPIIAITGSNGKTSTKELLLHVLSDNYKVHATKGNFNTKLGLSLSLLGLDNLHDISILEFGSSMPGEIKSLCEIAEPTHGLITNIAPAHLEGFGSIDKIVKEKSALFDSLSNGISFVNKADKRISNLNIKGAKITFGLTSDCDFPADINIESNGLLTLIIDSHIIPTKSYNLSFLKNSISVATIALTLGIKKNQLKSKITSFKPPKGRCYVKNINDVLIIDDTYNANLISSLAALDYLNAFSGDGRKIFVFGDMFELGQESNEQHKIIGKKCTNLNLDGVFTLGDNTKHTDSEIDDNIKHEHFNSPIQMIKSLKNFIQPGDKILFKGSRGMKMENIIKGIFIA